MLARAVALLIGLALVAAILFASLRGDDVPSAQSPAEAIEAARSPAPPTVLAMPDAAEREVAATPAADSASASTVEPKRNTPARHTVRGRVVDANGDPVVATVSARGFDFEGKLGFGGMAKSGTDGSFEVSHFRGGVLQLLAHAEELGTGALRDVNFDSPPVEPIEIVVTGPGIVRGRVLDDSGRAVPQLDLGVWLASLDDDAGSSIFPEPANSFAQLEGRGRTWANVITDAEGRFDVRGLRADMYVVRASASGGSPYPALLTPAPVVSDGTPLELRLQRTYLAVRAVNDRGQPFAGPIGSGTTATQWGDGRVEPMDRWPEYARVVVLPSGGEDDLTKLTNPRLAGTASDDGEFVFPVTADRAYRVGLMGGTQSWKPVDVFVPPDAGRIEVVLRATEVDAMGTLALVTRMPESNALGERFSVAIEDVEDGATLLFQDMHSTRASSGEFRLPEGRYRVVVQGESYIGWHGTIHSSTPIGCFESIVSITRDRTTRVEAALPIGARIELELVGTILDEDNTAVRASYPADTVFGGPLEGWSKRATTTLHAKNRRPILVHYPYLVTGSTAAGTHLGPWLAIGTSGTSETLPAGQFRFEARMPGGRVVTRDVTLVDGETLKLVIAMPSVPASAVDGK